MDTRVQQLWRPRLSFYLLGRAFFFFLVAMRGGCMWGWGGGELRGEVKVHEGAPPPPNRVNLSKRNGKKICKAWNKDRLLTG